MKVYPKIPRHDHPVVPEAFFDSEDLVVVEKFDGSAFRFTLYDERYADVYPKIVVDAADGDGSIVFGTRKSIRGCANDNLEEIDGALHRAVRCLREGIESDVLRRLHDEYSSPLIVYAENLVYSTLDYGYTDGSLPALIGFDVLPYSDVKTMMSPANPYAETFDGFLSTTATWNVLEQIRDERAPTEHAFVPATILAEADGFDPESYEFPTSSLSEDVRVEGVVVRSDAHDRRVKLVREAFRELNREQFGQHPDETDTGAEYLVAAYCTPARIRTEVRSMVIEEGREFGIHLADDLYPRVVEDIWTENYQEIMQLNIELTPADVYPLVAKRCVAELRKMETNAELNAADPTTIWHHLS
ncbi:RNA ligase family protein [Halobellus rarus]|uniref:RNA ligase family protein n=1 Tax=Halobellus rarus TaxID=1126237 RepID=A0ABD6CN89_9EURY|nr:RNA ligase family protein [Halobellus rarus]